MSKAAVAAEDGLIAEIPEGSAEGIDIRECCADGGREPDGTLLRGRERESQRGSSGSVRKDGGHGAVASLAAAVSGTRSQGRDPAAMRIPGTPRPARRRVSLGAE